jgi:hypothetical protein
MQSVTRLRLHSKVKTAFPAFVQSCRQRWVAIRVVFCAAAASIVRSVGCRGSQPAKAKVCMHADQNWLLERRLIRPETATAARKDPSTGFPDFA